MTSEIVVLELTIYGMPTPSYVMSKTEYTFRQFSDPAKLEIKQRL